MDSQWRSVVENARHHLSGRLSYAFPWTDGGPAPNERDTCESSPPQHWACRYLHFTPARSTMLDPATDPLVDVLLHLLVAFGIGALIGLEREQSESAGTFAGSRTFRCSRFYGALVTLFSRRRSRSPSASSCR